MEGVIRDEELFLKALKMVGKEVVTMLRAKNLCDECDRQAEIVAIGINAPLWKCPECGADIKGGLIDD